MKLFLKRFVFYLISFTWGGLMSIIGLIVLIATLPFGKFGIYHGRIYKTIGEDWGGLNLGCFFLCDSFATDRIKTHECGHGIQNCVWGPLMPFFISIPSAIRYWHRKYLYRYNKPKYCKIPGYDSVWFERQATRLGLDYIISDKF